MKDKDQNKKLLFKLLSIVAKHDLKKGFSLLEVVISIGIIVTVITSATGILVTVIKSNSDNLNTLVAYGLAQEGIEGMRMILDSNFLLGVRFDGTHSSNRTSIWGTAVFTSGEEKDLVLVKNLHLLPSEQCNVKNFRKACLPFSLEQAELDTNERVFKTEDGDFLQGSDIASNLISTPFSRVIQVIPKINNKDSGKINELIVNSIVTWKGNNRQLRTVELSTILTDWKFK